MEGKYRVIGLNDGTILVLPGGTEDNNDEP